MIELLSLLQQSPGALRGRAEIFNEIFLVFLTIGTIVGVVVVLYTLYHVHKYRDTGDSAPDDGFEPPTLGELPGSVSSGKSKKLFVSFAISAIIVVSVVVYAYGLLLLVETTPDDVEIDDNVDNMEIEVVGFQFGWEFHYPNGHVEFNTLRVPQGEDRVIRLEVTSRDVWHTFGVTELRIKADSIPGEYATTWFVPDEEGEYLIECFELCGVGHSVMHGEIQVMDEDEFNDWYEGTMNDNETNDENEDGEN